MLGQGRDSPMVGMHKKSLAQKLLDVTPAFADRQVAMMIADRALEYGQPYRFAINHDTRPPKNLACPMEYDWALKDSVGIDTTDMPLARRWLTKALIRGYTISRVDERHHDMVPGFSSSLAIVRRRAESHQRPKLDTDDDIPF
jgi:hypothetical protein